MAARANAPRRRRIVQMSDSDSETEANSVPQGNCANLYPQFSAAEERDDLVRYLISTFPKLASFVIYDALHKNNFNLKLAVTKLQKLCREPPVIVDYDQWKLANGKLKRPLNAVNAGQNREEHAAKRQRVDEVLPPEHIKKLHDSDDIIFAVVSDGGSDSDGDAEYSVQITEKPLVFQFFNNAPLSELLLVKTCSQKRADLLVSLRPFKSWSDLITKLNSEKLLNQDLITYAQTVLNVRKNMEAVLKQCTIISQRLACAIKKSIPLKEQPELLTSSLKLKNYQLIGLNWLVVLHQHRVNGILADEMGLGKTVQVIAFLAHLKAIQGANAECPTLIVVPSSTLQNWSNEMERWCPSLSVLIYHGAAEERRQMRFELVRGALRNYDVILTTYSIVCASPEERKMFRVTRLNYAIFDEAHMMKNMNTQRYESLSRIRAAHRILLTGTPLQNNLFELLSLLNFVVPDVFNMEELKSLFSKTVKKDSTDKQPSFERTQIEQAKRIMEPFVLRRLKADVLNDMPTKHDQKITIEMEAEQARLYSALIADYQLADRGPNDTNLNGMSIMMDLRKMANHTMLMRCYYTEKKVRQIAKLLAVDSLYTETNEAYILEDLFAMSDYNIDLLTRNHPSIRRFRLPDKRIFQSGKITFIAEKLKEVHAENKLLIFSQFVIMLDVIERYLKLVKRRFLRLDGSTPVGMRQTLIDQFTNDPEICIFLLSTRAGGLGINLTAANTVIIHDIDFNPYNDRQAEDRCYRIGQTRDVSIYRLIAKGTIEEAMWLMTQEKLKLEKEVTTIVGREGEDEQIDLKNIVSLLSMALNLGQDRVTDMVSPKKIGPGVSTDTGDR